MIAAYPGATPEIVEQQVAIPIEQAVAGVDGVTIGDLDLAQRLGHGLRSTSTSARTSRSISADVEQALSRIQSRLPANVDPTVLAGTTDDIPVIVWPPAARTATTRSWPAGRATVLPALNNIEGVREATLTGARAQQVTITVDPAKLAAARPDRAVDHQRAHRQRRQPCPAA